MKLTYEFACKWLEELKMGWFEKNIEKATNLFKKTTYYQETPFVEGYTTFEEIQKEWQHIKNQNIKKIEFLILAIDGNTLIVNWIFERDSFAFNGIYEIKFNDYLECIFFRSWEMGKELVHKN